MEEIKNIVKENWISFMKEMHEWELYCDKIDMGGNFSADEAFILEKDSLINIFKKYCTKKERVNGKPNIISYGLPGSFQYDLNEEFIVDIEMINENKYSVLTRRNKPLKVEYLYIFLKKGDLWLLDTKKRRFEDENESRAISL